MTAHLALVMIVRDEARCIERCLDSVRARVDEMVVLDTGSVDDTAGIAQRAGARVAPLRLVRRLRCRAQRRAGAGRCRLALVLDADEWMVAGARAAAAARQHARHRSV